MRQPVVNRLLAGLAGVLLLASAGCNELPGPAGRPSASNPGKGGSTAGTTTPVALTDADKSAAEAAVGEFTSAILKKEFDKAVALTTVDLRKQRTDKKANGELNLFSAKDKELGYSADDVTRWLQKETGDAEGTGKPALTFAPTGTGVSARGELTGKAARRFFSLRLTRADKKWQVADFATAPFTASAKPEGGTPEVLWAREFALDFLESLAAGDPNESAALMTPALRKKVAEPTTESDRKLGYDDFALRNWIKARAEGLEGFSLAGQSASGETATFNGQLVRKNGGPFTLSLAFDKATGTWGVSDFGTGK
jgi:hypothetical protein